MIKCPYKSYNEHEYDNSCYIRYERFEINNETFISQQILYLLKYQIKKKKNKQNKYLSKKTANPTKELNQRSIFSHFNC